MADGPLVPAGMVAVPWPGAHTPHEAMFGSDSSKKFKGIYQDIHKGARHALFFGTERQEEISFAAMLKQHLMTMP